MLIMQLLLLLLLLLQLMLLLLLLLCRLMVRVWRRGLALERLWRVERVAPCVNVKRNAGKHA